MTYTPTTDEVETAFHEFASELETAYPGSFEEAPEFSNWKQAMYGFRRWYAEEIRKAKQEAWQAGVVASGINLDWQLHLSDHNPYTEETQ